MLRLGNSLVRLVGSNEAVVQKGAAALSTSFSRQYSATSDFEKHQMPERLLYIPDADDPPFFESVEYFFHRGCQVRKLLQGYLSQI